MNKVSDIIIVYYVDKYFHKSLFYYNYSVYIGLVILALI